LDLRSAHRAVGNVLREASSRNVSFREIAERMLGIAGEGAAPELFDPVAAAGELRYGNGPGSLVVAEQIKELRHDWRRFAAEAQSQAKEWNEADTRLHSAVAGLIAA